MYNYMVEFKLPELNKEIQEAIPKQRATVDKLFYRDVLLSYMLSSDRYKLWAVFKVDSESELLTYIEALPLTRYCDYDYSELYFYDSATFVPTASMN